MLLATFMWSCKTEIIDTPAQLQIHVVDESNTSIAGAEVSLFATLDDWQNSANVLSTQTTDSDGTVLFTDLDEKIYYFWVEKDELNNNFSVAATEKKLSINVVAQVEVVIN